mgnify:CR=1 FL=1
MAAKVEGRLVTCPHCGSEDVEYIVEFRARYLFLCGCCSKDFSIPKSPDVIEEERCR